MGLLTLELDAFSNCLGFTGALSMGDKIESFPERLFENIPISSINFYGQKRFSSSNCRIFNRINIANVNVLPEYESDTFCNIRVDKNLILPTSNPTSNPTSIPTERPSEHSPTINVTPGLFYEKK